MELDKNTKGSFSHGENWPTKTAIQKIPYKKKKSGVRSKKAGQ
jgi:hypothetical protein